MSALVRRFWPEGRMPASPLVAVGLAIVLLVASLLLGLHNERQHREEKVRDVEIQAAILAGSVAAPLAFDDTNATSEYLGALKANPEIQAAGAYDINGHFAAGYTRTGAKLPSSNRVGPAHFEGSDVVVTAVVAQNGTTLGSVYLRAATESWARRATRYVGIAILLVMASLLVAVLGISYASVSDAHRRLRAEADGREKAEEALRQSQKMEAMGQLTGGVAHDFNNLLMVASSGLDLMDRTDDLARRERLKQGIRQAIDRGAKLTQQLLTFARRSPLKPEVVNLERRIRGLQDLLDRSLREDVTIDLSFPPGLWPVEVDVSQFEVALLNIALNARDAMPDGGTIRMSAQNVPGPAPDGADMVRLSIADTGTGMAPENIAKVFEPFFTTKGVGQGTGLGLSQVYGFARSSGGDVNVESEVGMGTTIVMLLPRSHKTAVAEIADPGSPQPARGRYRILLVEDDDHVADLVGEMLDELGYERVRVPSAAAALETLAADAAFDLVFSDMVMPGAMSGLDLAREIARSRPALPVVLTTGYSAAAAAAMADGLELLTKPYSIQALAGTLRKFLGGDRSGNDR
uniref:ATP-binding protein n=1 Tax=Sphingomonas bacterium TaxID=1895847 RepID=UPI002624CE67|nr:ATP-binding protein [Sphingomonas bacterium]